MNNVFASRSLCGSLRICLRLRSCAVPRIPSISSCVKSSQVIKSLPRNVVLDIYFSSLKSLIGSSIPHLFVLEPSPTSEVPYSLPCNFLRNLPCSYGLIVETSHNICLQNRMRHSQVSPLTSFLFLLSLFLPILGSCQLPCEDCFLHPFPVFAHPLSGESPVRGLDRFEDLPVKSGYLF